MPNEPEKILPNVLQAMRAQAYPMVLDDNGMPWYMNTIAQRDAEIATLRAQVAALGVKNYERGMLEMNVEERISEVRRARDFRKKWPKTPPNYGDVLVEEIDNLRSLLKDTRDALHPFAEAAYLLDPKTPDGASIWETNAAGSLSAGDLWRAREAFNVDEPCSPTPAPAASPQSAHQISGRTT